VTGFYTAGSSTGIDTVQVQDAVLDTVTATATVVPGPDYAVSLATMPTGGAPGAAFVGAPTLDFTIQETSGNAGTLTVSWKVYISTDMLLDGGDVLADSGSIAPLAASGSQLVNFAGTWPGSPGKYYYLLVDLTAGDDTNPVNNGYISAVIPVPDTFTESEPNDSASPPWTNVDDVGTLSKGQLLVVMAATMDAPGGYDTYKFTAGGGMTKIDIKATWNTGSNDIDLFFWDAAGGLLADSQVTDPDAEPKTGAKKVTGLTPGDYFIGVFFGPTSSGSDNYDLTLEGS
jgi:hypothetical protein